MVAALRGTVGVDNREVTFILEEEDAKYNEEKATFESGPNVYFPHEKLLRLKLMCSESDEFQGTLSFFDSVLLDIVKEDHIERWVTCMDCRDQEEDNRFCAVKEFLPRNELAKCENGHGWPIQRLKSKASDACLNILRSSCSHILSIIFRLRKQQLNKHQSATLWPIQKTFYKPTIQILLILQ